MASPRFVKLSSLDLNALLMPPPPTLPPTPLQQPQISGDGAASPSTPPPSLSPCEPRHLTTLLEYAVERGQDAIAGALLKGGAGASVRHDAAAAGHGDGAPSNTALAAVHNELGCGYETTRSTSCPMQQQQQQPLQGSHCAVEDARDCLSGVLPMPAGWIVKQVGAMRAAAAATVAAASLVAEETSADAGALTGMEATVVPPVGEARGGGFEHGPATSAGVWKCADSAPATCSICRKPPTCPLLDPLCGHLCCEACVWARLRAEQGRAGVGCPCGSGAGSWHVGRTDSGAIVSGGEPASCGDDAEECCGEGGGEEGSAVAEAKCRKQASAERCV